MYTLQKQPCLTTNTKAAQAIRYETLGSDQLIIKGRGQLFLRKNNNALFFTKKNRSPKTTYNSSHIAKKIIFVAKNNIVVRLKT